MLTNDFELTMPDLYLDTIMCQIFKVTNLNTDKFWFKTSWKMFTQRGVCNGFAIFSDVAYLAILMVGHKTKELHQNGTF